MNIPTRICPLCSKELLVGDEDTEYTYYCNDFYLRYNLDSSMMFGIRELSKYHNGKIKEPHYSVTINNGIWIQSTLIPPFWIISSSETQKSKIYKFDKDITTPSDKYLILDIPILAPSDYLPDNFARKIKNLVIFS